jgi:hypothetical protein
MNEITFTSVKHIADEDGNNAGLVAVHDGKTTGVSMRVGNYMYDEIMRQVDAGDLTIEDAD